MFNKPARVLVPKYVPKGSGVVKESKEPLKI